MSFFERERRRRRSIWDPWDFMSYIEELFENFEKEFFREIENLRSRPFEKKIGPFIYGYSITIGPDGKPIIREFGTVPKERKPGIEPEFTREPLVDISETDEEVIITAETPGVKKEDIEINATERELEIKAGDKFYKRLDLPTEVNPDKAKATYNNGILEVRLEKREKRKRLEGKRIRVE